MGKTNEIGCHMYATRGLQLHLQRESRNRINQIIHNSFMRISKKTLINIKDNLYQKPIEIGNEDRDGTGKKEPN